MRDAGEEALNRQDHKGAWKYIRAATFTTPKGGGELMNIQALNDHFAQIVQASVREPIAHTSSCDNSDSFAFQAA